MKISLSRRRFLVIAASAAAVPSLAGAETARWSGVALGAGASMRLEGIDAAQAAPVFAAVEAEVRRLEAIFSLHDTGSALARLNRDGRIDAPPAEMLELLSLAGQVNRASGGAFDPTVQPLWMLYASETASGRLPQDRALSEARQRIGWDQVRFDAGQVAFARPGMAMTLNGIAQGYITDRVRALLGARGLTNILIDMGEIAASGTRADGEIWTAGIAQPDGRIVRRVRLQDRALATSSPSGTLLDARGLVGHILDPRTGEPATQHSLVSVSAASAALADGLSTACCLLPSDAAARAVAAMPTARIEAMV